MDFSDILFFVVLVVFSLLPKERRRKGPRKGFVPKPAQEVEADADRVRRKMEALRRKRTGAGAASAQQNTMNAAPKEAPLRKTIEVRLPEPILPKVRASTAVQALESFARNIDSLPALPAAHSSVAKTRVKLARSQLKTWMLGKFILEQPKFKENHYGSLVGR